MTDAHPPTSNRPKLFLDCRAFFFLSFLFFAGVVLHQFVITQTQLVRKGAGSIAINDITYYFILIKSFWFEEAGNIYRTDTQFAILSGVFGFPMVHAMPVGITPTALLVLFPFAALAQVNYHVAFTVWTMFSIVVLVFGCWSMYRFIQAKQNGFQEYDRIILFASVLAFPTLLSFVRGQTAALATGLLCLLVVEVVKAEDENRRVDSWRVLALMVVLSIKPHYFALALCLLFFFRQISALFASSGIVLALLLILSFPLGFSWWADYLGSLRAYSGLEIPEYYRWTFAPALMNVFRYAFQPPLSDSMANEISKWAFFGGVSALCFMNIIKLYTKTHLALPRETTLTIAVFGLYLLFSPHLSDYEDMLFIVPLTLYLTQRGGGFSGRAGAIFAFLMMISLNQFVLKEFLSSPVMWLTKFSLILQLLWLTQRTNKQAVEVYLK